MPFYTGKGVPGEPGFEMEEFQGFPVSRCGNYWGNGPVDKDGYLIMEDEKKEVKFKHKSKYHG